MDKKEQLHKSPDAIQEVEEKSDDEDGESKAPSKIVKQKTASKEGAKLAPKKKALTKVVRGIQISAGMGGGHEESVTKSEVDRMIQKALSDQADQFNIDNKNLEADKLAFETKLRRAMQDLVAPCVEQGIKHKEQFVETIQKLHDHEQRIIFAEDVMYRNKTVDNRFDDIEMRFAKMEEQRALDNETWRNEHKAHRNEMDKILHQQEIRLAKIDLLMTN